MLSSIVDVIILVAAVCGAILGIYKFVKDIILGGRKLAKDAKEKEEKELKEKVRAIVKEMMPDILHGLETREEHQADRISCLTEIKGEVARSIQNDIGVIQELKNEVAKLSISAKDVLREKIMKIYYDNRAVRTVTEHEREALEQYYKDYKALGGNSYIDRYYNRMLSWKVIADDYED